MLEVFKLKNKQKIQSNNYAVDPKSMIQTFDLMKIYNITEGIEIRALDMVNININKGEFVSVMGPSGSGKTTLLNMIGALDNPSGGAVFINGTDIAYMNDNQRTHLRLRDIGFIFQFYNLVPVLTVYENIELPLYFEVLDLVKLSDQKDFLPSELSGGEKQRVAIARALINEPALLIADEPTGELDTKMGMEIIQLLRDLNKELNQTILMVTHDPAIGDLAERTIRMRDGKILS